MLVYQQREFLLFVLHSFLCGTALGALYDCLRISRLMLGIAIYPSKLGKTLGEKSFPLIGKVNAGKRSGKLGKLAKNTLLFLGDILFMVVAAVAVICVAFFRNDGKIRMIAIVFTVLGFACYRISLGRPVIACSSLIVFIIRLVRAYLWFFLTLPLKLVGKALVRSYRYCNHRIGNRMAARQIYRQGLLKREEIIFMAGTGFLSDKPPDRMLKNKTEDTKKQNESKKKIRTGL